MTTHQKIAKALACVFAVTLASCNDSSTTPSPDPTPTAAPSAAPSTAPATTAIFDGSWTGTTNTGKAVSFRVLSGQLMDLAVSFDLGSGCVYRVAHPDTFDPRDPVYPIDDSGRVAFRFGDAALRMDVALQFTSAQAVRGNFTAADLRTAVSCATPPKSVAAGTFTATR